MSDDLLLALDTSTRGASVALYDGQTVLSETNWLAGREHSSRLAIELEAAMERVGRVLQQVSGLVVARGPGSFTGVRVGLSLAKGIAAGLGVPAWGVSTLDVVAAAATASELPVRAVLEAGRGRYATALYVGGGQAEAPRLATLAELVELLASRALVIGELDARARAVLAAESSARLASPAACVRRAGLLAELGWRLKESGQPGDPGALDAVYVS